MGTAILFTELDDREVFENQSFIEEVQAKFLLRFTADRSLALQTDYQVLDDDAGNWLKAIRLSPWREASKMASTLFEYFQARGLWFEIEEIWKKLIKNSPDDVSIASVKVSLLHQLGITFLNQGRRNETVEYLQSCLELARDINFKQLEADTLYQLGVNEINLGNYKAAKEYLNKSLEARGQTEDKKGYLFTQGQMANILAAEGKLDEAASILNENLIEWGNFKDLNKQRLAHSTLHALGRVRLMQKKYQDAKAAFEESLRLKRILDAGANQIAHTNCLLAEANVALEDFSTANQLLKQGVQESISLGDYTYAGIAKKIFGYIEYKQKNYKLASTIFTQAGSYADMSGNLWLQIEIGVWRIRVGVRVMRYRDVYFGVKAVIKNIRIIDLPISAKIRLLLSQFAIR